MTHIYIWVKLDILECTCATSPQSCSTLCGPMDCSPPSFSIHEILQTRVLEWIAMPSSGDLPNTGTEPSSLMSLALADRFFYH